MSAGLDALFYHLFFGSPEHKLLSGTVIFLTACQCEHTDHPLSSLFSSMVDVSVVMFSVIAVKSLQSEKCQMFYDLRQKKSLICDFLMYSPS